MKILCIAVPDGMSAGGDCCGRWGVTCNCISWVRNAGFEHGAGKLPMSNHHPHCKEFKLEEFAKVTIDGTSCVMEKGAAYIEHEAVVETIFMTRDQFERLKEFDGF